MPEHRLGVLRRPAFWLLLLLAADLAAQVWTLQAGWRANPFLRMPQSDAQEYWDWAARIAAGEWIGPTPFFSAPLYPYVLGAVRALGGGLLTVFGIQIALRTLTAWLLYRFGAARLGGAGLGLAAAGTFLALGEPAFFAMRVLNSSLQLFLLAALLLAAHAADAQRTRGRLACVGALLGLNVLANPTMLLMALVLPLWLGWRSRAGLRAAAWTAAVAALFIAPASAHNWLATRHSPGGPELILVSAQSGVTYAHGNSAAAVGHYAPVPGVATERIRQNESAYELAKAATGKEGWKNVNSYFFRLGLDWNLSHPAEALLLHARKTAYLFCGRHYSDIASATWECRDPSFPRPVPWPGGGLPTGWLLVPALVGAAFLAARQRASAVPAVFLLLLPMAVVVIFWYSPRYRLPVAVPASLLAPYALVALGRWRPRAVGAAAAALTLAVPLGAEAALRARGFDDASLYQAEYEMHLGEALMNLGAAGPAYDRFENSLVLGYEQAITYEYMGNMQVDLGREREAAGDRPGGLDHYQEAIRLFSRAIELNPERLFAFMGRGTTLLYLGQRDAGLGDLRQALDLARRQNHAEAVAKLEDYLRKQGVDLSPR